MFLRFTSHVNEFYQKEKALFIIFCNTSVTGDIIRKINSKSLTAETAEERREKTSRFQTFAVLCDLSG